MNVDVILPAGGRITGAFADEVGTEVKALIQFDGRTVLDRTVAALRSLARVQRIVIIGPESLREYVDAQGADSVLPEGGSGVDNIYRGLDWLRTTEGTAPGKRVLILTTDLPFVTATALDGFLDACPHDSIASVPILSKAAIEARFPGLGGSYIRLYDGEWTAGGAFVLDPIALERNRLHIEQIYAARKSGLAMAMLLGPRLITRFMCRRATVAHVQRRCEQILGGAGAAVTGCAPELAFDIDVIEEYRYAVQWLAGEHTRV